MAVTVVRNRDNSGGGWWNKVQLGNRRGDRFPIRQFLNDTDANRYADELAAFLSTRVEEE